MLRAGSGGRCGSKSCLLQDTPRHLDARVIRENVFLRIRVADAVLIDSASFYNDISVHRVRALGELVSRLAVEIVAATVLGSGCVHLG